MDEKKKNTSLLDLPGKVKSQGFSTALGFALEQNQKLKEELVKAGALDSSQISLMKSLIVEILEEFADQAIFLASSDKEDKTALSQKLNEIKNKIVDVDIEYGLDEQESSLIYNVIEQARASSDEEAGPDQPFVVKEQFEEVAEVLVRLFKRYSLIKGE